VQWAIQPGSELTQEQYVAMNPEQQAAYWAQWQYYAQYYDHQQQQQQYPAAQYQQTHQVLLIYEWVMWLAIDQKVLLQHGTMY